MSAKYHTHGSRFGGSCLRAACGAYEPSFVKPPEWFRDHPYPASLAGHVCQRCEKKMNSAGFVVGASASAKGK
jgi:hypothetical protein